MGWQGEKCYLEMQESLNSSRCYFCYTCCPRDNLKPMLWQVLAGLFFNNFLDVKKLSKGIHHLKCAVIYMEFFRPFCLVIGCWFIRSLSPLGIHHFHLVWGLKVSLTHAHRLGTSLWLLFVTCCFCLSFAPYPAIYPWKRFISPIWLTQNTVQTSPLVHKGALGSHNLTDVLVSP